MVSPKEIWYISLYSKMRRQGDKGGPKKLDLEETSFMDDILDDKSQYNKRLHLDSQTLHIPFTL